PVIREKGVDAALGLRWCGVRRFVDQLLRTRRIRQRKEHICGPQEREPSMGGISKLAGGHADEYLFCLLAAAEHREYLCANKIRLRCPASPDGRVSQTIGETVVCKPHPGLGGPDEEVRIRLEVGVKAQHGAPHDNSRVVTVSGCGKF